MNYRRRHYQSWNAEYYQPPLYVVRFDAVRNAMEWAVALRIVGVINTPAALFLKNCQFQVASAECLQALIGEDVSASYQYFEIGGRIVRPGV